MSVLFAKTFLADVGPIQVVLVETFEAFLSVLHDMIVWVQALHGRKVDH